MSENKKGEIVLRIDSDVQIEKADEVLTKSLEGAQLDPIVLGVANQYLSGATVEDMAEEYDVAPDIIIATLERPEVKRYVDSSFLSQGYLNRVRRNKIINQVIEDKIRAAETGEEAFSKEDLLKWIKQAHEEEKAMRPKETGPKVAIQVNNNYESLMKDLTKNG